MSMVSKRLFPFVQYKPINIYIENINKVVSIMKLLLYKVTCLLKSIGKLLFFTSFPERRNYSDIFGNLEYLQFSGK